MADGLAEHVTCSICLELYDDPLALPCMHSFCRRCIQGIVASSMSLTCPACRKDTKLGQKGIAGLAKNFQLASIVASFKEKITRETSQSNPRLPKCTAHRLSCPVQCKKCRIPVCLQCITDNQHHTHQFNIIDDTDDVFDAQSDIYCDKHMNEYKLYCKTCQNLVCLRCLTERDHSKHLYSTIDTAYDYQKMMLENQLRELEKQQQTTATTWKGYRDIAQKTQSDAQRKREQLTSYFSRLKDALERKEHEMRAELDNRERKALEECKRKIDVLQTSEKNVNNVSQRIKQLLTEERLRLLNSDTNSLQRTLSNEVFSHQLYVPSSLQDVSLATCQFEKEIRNIKWEWPKQVPDQIEYIEPTAPPIGPVPPVPRPRQRPQSQRSDRQLQPQQYYTQQHNQRHYQENRNELAVGSLVQRGKHWKSGMEDGGPGHMGTVVQTTVDPHVYMVRWPNGKTGSYTYNAPWKEEIVPP